MNKPVFLTLSALLATSSAIALAAPAATVEAPGAAATADTTATTTTAMGPPATSASAVAVPQLPATIPSLASLGDARERASAAATALSLEDAIALTLRNDPQRAAARAALAAAQARIGEAHSAGGPVINLQANGSLNRGSNSTNNVNNGNINGINSTSNNTILGFRNNESAGVTATIPIYTGGRVKAGTRAAEYQAQSEAELTLQVEQDLVLQATNAYLTVLRNDQLLQVQVSNLAVSRERQRISNLRYQAGAAARLDVFSANTVLAGAEQSRVVASNNLAQAKANLNTLMARAPETPLRVEPVTSLTLKVPLPGDLTQSTAATSAGLRGLSESERPSIAAANSDTLAAQANVDVAKAQRKPSLGATASGLLLHPATTLGRFALSLGLSVVQTLFDSGRSKSQIAEANALLDQARANAGNTRLGVANSIESALLALDSAQGSLSTAETGVSEAQAALAAAQLGYSAGARTALDVSDAQTNLLSAQTTEVNTKFDVAASQAQLSSAVGILSGEGQAAYQRVLQQELREGKTPVRTTTRKKRKKFLGIF